MKQYKVIKQKDGLFSGNFDPEKLEDQLNELAKSGWRVVSAASTGKSGGNRDEFIIIMERDV